MGVSAYRPYESKNCLPTPTNVTLSKLNNQTCPRMKGKSQRERWDLRFFLLLLDITRRYLSVPVTPTRSWRAACC